MLQLATANIVTDSCHQTLIVTDSCHQTLIVTDSCHQTLIVTDSVTRLSLSLIALIVTDSHCHCTRLFDHTDTFRMSKLRVLSLRVSKLGH